MRVNYGQATNIFGMTFITHLIIDLGKPGYQDQPCLRMFKIFPVNLCSRISIMLTKSNIQKQIQQNAPQIRKYGINKIGLFGSFARQKQSEESDIDILIDFEEGSETFDNFMAVCALLDSLFLNHKVEVVTTKGLSPYIGPHILNSVEYVQIAN